jgi:EpsI family protein
LASITARRSLWIATILLVATSIYTNLVLNRVVAHVPRETLNRFPIRIDQYVGMDESFSSSILKNLGVDEYLMRRYSDGVHPVWLYLGYYGNQMEGAVPHSPRHCYPGGGWFPLKHGIEKISVDSSGRKDIFVNRYVFSRGQERECVIYWYQSRGRAVANEYVEKMYLIRDSIFRNRSDGALVRISASSDTGNEKETLDRLVSFAQRIYPIITRHVPD